MKIHYLKLSLLTFVSFALLSLGAKAQVSGSSINIGTGNYVPGTYAGGFGQVNGSTANCSFGFGNGSWAKGDYSLVAGYQSETDGTASTAFGAWVWGGSYCEVVIGRYNLGGISTVRSTYNKTAWVSTDPLLEVGNGTGNTVGTASNALTIYKNGNATFQGSIRCSPGGDLSMGSYTAGTHP